MILSLQSLEVIPLWTLNAWPSISTLYACSYNFPINDQGECPQSCDFDPNLDGNIDILDILSLIIIILSCGDCEISCGDIIDDNDDTNKNVRNYLVTGIVLTCDGGISVAPNVRTTTYENDSLTEYKVNFQFKF